MHYILSCLSVCEYMHAEVEAFPTSLPSISRITYVLYNELSVDDLAAIAV